ncbi:MAG: cadmium-translocating P-type ATPase [Chloroflexi bacterium]|nr:cadmium-translocating P-type ATPase [Chloroflexota bacterium]
MSAPLQVATHTDVHEEYIPIPFQDEDPETRRCLEIFMNTLKSHPGVEEVRWEPEHQRLVLKYNPHKLPFHTLEGIAKDLGLELQRRHRYCVIHLDPARCRECTEILESRLSQLPGVVSVEANVPGGTVTVEYEPDAPLTPSSVEQTVRKLGFRVLERVSTFQRRTTSLFQLWRQNHELVLATIALLFLVTGLVIEHFTSLPRWAAIGAYAISIIAGGYEGARSAIPMLRQGVLDIDFLMIVSALGAAYIGHWAEGATLLFLFSLSGALETFAMDRTRHAIEKLMELRPKEATVRRNGQEVRVPVEELEVGEEVIVRPGEAIPVDGVVVEGISAVDQSPITGESIPVTKRPGDKVFAGTINTEGSLVIRVTKRASDSTLAKIIQLVEEAQSERAPMQRLIDKYSQPYATAVVLGVLAYIGVGTWVLKWPFHEVFYRAMTLLVVASPCALVISTPASILSAIAAGARNGVLFKGGMHLENMARIQIVAFDKTGTLTYGKPQVVRVVPAPGFREEDVLYIAGSVERRSEHPLAKAIVKYAQERGISLDEPDMFRALVGKGVRAELNGERIYIGNDRLMKELGREIPPELEALARQLRNEGMTVVWVSNKQVVGLLAIADVVRPQAAQAIRELRALGVKRIVMLTGDHRGVAEAIARQVGVDEVYAELLPEDKVNIIRQLDQEAPTAMVGDGINDAPAMALATVGIAMGAAGTDVALETADVVLMADDLLKLPFALDLSRRARRIVYQNLAFSVGVMVVLVISTLTVGIPLPLGVVGHEGSTLIVVLNGLRLLGLSPKEEEPTQASPVPVAA